MPLSNFTLSKERPFLPIIPFGITPVRLCCKAFFYYTVSSRTVVRFFPLRPADAVSSYLRIPSPVYRFSHLYDFDVSYKLFFMSLDEHFTSPTLPGSKSRLLLHLGNQSPISTWDMLLVIAGSFLRFQRTLTSPTLSRLKFRLLYFSRHPLFYPSWDRSTGFVGSFLRFRRTFNFPYSFKIKISIALLFSAPIILSTWDRILVLSALFYVSDEHLFLTLPPCFHN